MDNLRKALTIWVDQRCLITQNYCGNLYMSQETKEMNRQKEERYWQEVETAIANMFLEFD